MISRKEDSHLKSWLVSKFKKHEFEYDIQAIILHDIKNLGYTAYYDWDYDDENKGAESLVLFDVSAMDKVIPIQLSWEDMNILVDAIDSHKLDLSDLYQVVDFVKLHTGQQL